MGLDDVLKLVRLPDEDKKKINGLLFEISGELVEAERCALKIVKEIQEIESRLPQKVKKQTLPSSSFIGSPKPGCRGFLQIAQRSWLCQDNLQILCPSLGCSP